MTTGWTVVTWGCILAVCVPRRAAEAFAQPAPDNTAVFDGESIAVGLDLVSLLRDHVITQYCG